MAVYAGVFACCSLFTLPFGGMFVVNGWSQLADLILVDFTAPNLTPCHDAANNLAYAAHGSNVVMNMARGKVIYKNGEFLTIDIDRVKKEVAGYALPLLFGR